MAGAGERLGGFIKENARFIIIASAVLMLVAIVYSGNIYMATGTETFVSPDTQLYHDIEYYKEHFQATTFLILISSDDVLNPEVLDAMDALCTRLYENPHINSVTGPPTIIKNANLAAGGGAIIPRNIEEVEALFERSSKDASFMMPDRHNAIITVELKGTVEERDEAQVLDEVRRTLEWSSMPPGTSAVLTGSTAMMLEVQSQMMSSLMLMLLTAVGLMVLALWITFSHARWRLLPLPIVLVGVIITGGAMGFTGVPMTMVSMAVFPILIGLGVEYAVQFQNRLMEELNEGKPRGDAIVSTIKNIGPAVSYSMMTTCLGFLAILSSPVPMIFDFGLMCLIGIIVCFLVALFLLTSVVKVMPSVERTIGAGNQAGNLIESTIGRVAEATTKRPWIVLLALMVMAAGYFIDPTIGVEVDSSTFAPQDLQSVMLFRTLNNIVGYKTDTMIIQVKADDVTSPDAIAWMDSFSGYEMANNPDALSSSSLSSLLKLYNNGTLPQSRAGIDRVLNEIPFGVKRLYVDDYGTTGIVRLTIQDQPTEKKISMFDRVGRDIEFHAPPPGINASLGGEAQMMLSTLGSLTGERLTMTALSGLCVFLGLMLVYRGDWIKASVPVIVVMVVTGLSCAVMFLLGMKYTPLSVTLGALTIGIGIDFSILHMERYYEEKAKGLPPEEAMRVATAKIGNAIFTSASTVIAGFGALAMSNFSILSNFGVVTIIDFMLALASAFVIMPPLLITLDRWKNGRPTPDAGEAIS